MLAPPKMPPKPATSGKTFAVTTLNPGSVGKKVMIYADPGAGKTTLAALAPDPVFIDLDKGAYALGVRAIQGVETFDDLRAALQQYAKLVPDHGTLVLDTLTAASRFIDTHLLRTFSKDRIKQLGFDRFPSAVEDLRLLLTDLDRVIASGRNVILVAHESAINYKNALGDDYRVVGPDLPHATTGSCRTESAAWCDHVFRIAYQEAVIETDEKGKNGKVRNATTARVIHTDGTQSMIAKSRPVNGQRLPALVSFADATDASLWKFIFA